LEENIQLTEEKSHYLNKQRQREHYRNTL